MYRLLIDADPIVYRAGFAAESNHYMVIVQGPDGDLQDFMFEPYESKKGRVTAHAQMKEFVAKLEPGYEIVHTEKIVVPEELSHALHLVNQSIEGIVAAATERYKVEASELDIRIVLSGPGNFREKLATIVPYKGNREEAHKPYWYQQIRDHLTGRWNARVVEGREADDEVSIQGWRQWRDGYRFNYLIATIDKDLDQVPGPHYDYRQKVFYNVTEEEARMAFWVQVLAGDATDNIPGCYRVGPAKAEQALRRCEEYQGSPCDDSQLWANVLHVYEESLKKEGCPYQVAYSAALETARLVYMQREPLELWTPPGEPKQWLEANIDD